MVTGRFYIITPDGVTLDHEAEIDEDGPHVIRQKRYVEELGATVEVEFKYLSGSTNMERRTADFARLGKSRLDHQ
jgi:hypothetical protein